MATEQSTGRRSWPTTKITLLERIANCEDDDSWKRFAVTYTPLVVNYCRQRGLQESDADDVAQDVMLQVSKGIGGFRYDASRGRFRNWLGTVTHRAMLKHRSKSLRRGVGRGGEIEAARLGGEMSQQPLDGAWVEAFNAHVFREAVGRIRIHFDAATWGAFQATFLDDQAVNDVATEMGRTVGWVYQAKSRVVRQLREEILYLAEDSVLLNLPKST